MIITWTVLIKAMAAADKDKEDEIVYEDIEQQREYMKLKDVVEAKWIKKAIKKPGALRKQLGVKKG